MSGKSATYFFSGSRRKPSFVRPHQFLCRVDCQRPTYPVNLALHLTDGQGGPPTRCCLGSMYRTLVVAPLQQSFLVFLTRGALVLRGAFFLTLPLPISFLSTDPAPGSFYELLCSAIVSVFPFVVYKFTFSQYQHIPRNSFVSRTAFLHGFKPEVKSLKLEKPNFRGTQSPWHLPEIPAGMLV